MPAPVLGPWSLRAKRAYYYLVLAAVLLAYLVCRRLVGSRIGRAFVAIRENEALAESVGVDVTHYLVLAAVVSAAMAGMAGSLYAHYTRFVSPEVFLFGYTVTMWTPLQVGASVGILAGSDEQDFALGEIDEEGNVVVAAAGGGFINADLGD